MHHTAGSRDARNRKALRDRRMALAVTRYNELSADAQRGEDGRLQVEINEWIEANGLSPRHDNQTNRHVHWTLETAEELAA